MKKFVIIFCIIASQLAVASEIEFSNAECVLTVDHQKVAASGQKLTEIALSFADGGHAHFLIPRAYWPPAPNRHYRWTRPGCSYCRQKMSYRDGVLELYSSRQYFTWERETLRIETDLDFKNPRAATLQEGIGFIPFHRFSCRI